MLLMSMVCASNIQAKERPFYGQIVNDSGKGIRGATLVVTPPNAQYQTDRNGYFSFNADEATSTALLIVAQDFESTKFDISILPEDSIIIELAKKKHILQDAFVGSKSKLLEYSTSGIHSGANATGCYMNIYDEIALYLPVQTNRIATVQEIGCYITDQGSYNNDFSIHLYAIDSQTGGPGKELLDSGIVAHSEQRNHWVRIDVSGSLVQFQKGLYISMEWIPSVTNYTLPWVRPAKYSNYFSGFDSLRAAYNGQVLGLDWRDAPPKVYRKYGNSRYQNKFTNQWYATNALNGGNKPNKHITPMLYCTYSYIKP